jgi:hypothetical protein
MSNRSAFLAVSAAAVLALLAGCGDSTVPAESQGPTQTVLPTNEPSKPPPTSTIPELPWRTAQNARSDADAWSLLKIDANWVEFYPSLEKTVEAVDLAGFANVIEIEPSDPIGDEPGGAIETVTLTMQIVDAVKSVDDSPTLRLRMEVPGLATSEQVVAELAPLLSSGTVFVALRRLENGDYRIINEKSIWAISSSGLGIAPVLTEFDEVSWRAYIDGYDDVSSMQEMYERLAAAR